MRKAVNLLRPPEKGHDYMKVQLSLSGDLKAHVQKLMDKYGLEQAAVCRMLIVEGLEARQRVA